MSTLLNNYRVSEACVCPADRVLVGSGSTSTGRSWIDNRCTDKCAQIITK